MDERYPHLSDDTLAAVDWFANQMKRKLEDNHHKGQRDTWLHMDVDALAYRVSEEAKELKEAAIESELRANPSAWKEDAQKVINEAADVGNMAMMTADRLRWRVEPEYIGE